MRNTFFLITAGILLPLLIQAQINEDVDLNKGNQDSIAFHQSFISESLSDDNSITARSTATNNNGSFTLGGNQDTYYPVVFKDNGWHSHEATIIEIGRSNVHENSLWNGSLIASFRFHLTKWGHGSHFIDVDLKQNHPDKKYFVGGWQDITSQSDVLNMIIWLRGAATYHYHSNYPQSPIYTSSNVTIEGKSYAPKIEKDSYVNIIGTTLSGNLWVLGSTSYFQGNVGIGTTTPKNKLDVAGTIRATEVKVETGWADFVFDKDYKLPSLEEVECHINEHKRLPDIPSESQVKEEGVGLGEMQSKLLQKIEELTLYVIDLKKENQEIKKQLNHLQQ